MSTTESRLRPGGGNWLAPLVRALAGDDIFISYSRADATTYALALAGRLLDRGFATRIDQWGAPPGKKVPPQILRAVRRSGLLVVVGSAGAAQSAAMGDEIKAFLRTGRPIVPIDLDGTLRTAVWWPLLEGLSVFAEARVEKGDPEARGPGPSDMVVDRIDKAFGYAKKNAILRRLSAIMIAGVLTGGTAAGVFGHAAAVSEARAALANENAENSVRDRKAAERARDSAVLDRSAAERARDSALLDRTAAERARDAALTAQALAADSARMARARAAAFDSLRRVAEHGLKQTDLLARSRLALSAGDPTRAHSLAAENLRLGDNTGGRMMLAAAYNQGLPAELHGLQEVRDLAVSPANPNIVAAIGRGPGRAPGDDTLILWNLATGEWHRATLPGYLAVAFVPDGTHLVAAAYVRLGGRREDGGIERAAALIRYDLRLGEVLRRPLDPISTTDGESGRRVDWDVRDIQDMKLDPSGRRLVMAGSAAPSSHAIIGNASPHHLRVWADPATLEPHVSVEADQELSSFSPYRGRVVFAANGTGIVRDGIADIQLIEVSTGATTPIGEHPVNVTDVTASPSGSRVAAVGSDGRLSVFTSEGGEWRRRVFEAGDGGIAQVRFADENRLVLAWDNLAVTVFSLDRLLDGPDVILSGTVEWQASRQRVLGRLSARVTDLAVSPDGRWVAVASADRTVHVWSLHQYHALELRGSRSGTNRLTFSPDSKRLYLAGIDGMVRGFELDPAHRAALPLRAGEARSEQRIPEARWTSGGELTQDALRERWGLIETARWSADRRELIAQGYDGIETVWDARLVRVRSDSAERRRGRLTFGRAVHGGRWAERTRDDRLVVHADRPLDRQTAMLGAFTPDGRTVVEFSYRDSSVYVWRVARPDAPVARFHLVFGTFAYAGGNPVSHLFTRASANSRYLAFPLTFDNTNAIAILDLSALTQVVYRSDFAAGVFDVSPTGEIAIGGRRGEIDVYSPARNATRRLGSHAARMQSVAFSPDGHWLASGSQDRTVRVWPLDGGDFQEYALLNPVTDVSFTPDGRRVVAASGFGLHTWLSPGGALQDVMAAASNSLASSVARERLDRIPSDVGPVFPSQRENLGFVVRRAGEAEPRSGTMRSHVSTARLATTLRDSPDGNARFRAARSLAGRGEDLIPYVEILCAALVRHGWRDNELPAAALALLAEIGARGEAPVLAVMANSRDSLTRRAAAEAVGQLYPRSMQARAALRALLHDPDPGVRLAGAITLSGVFGDSSAVPILMEAVSGNGDGGEDAVRALARLGPPAVQPLITAAALPHSRRNRPIADSAVVSLGRLGEAAVAPLLQALASAPGAAREPIIRALGQVGEPAAAAVPQLIAIVRESPGSTRTDRSPDEAIQALRRIGAGAEPAIPALVQIVLEEDASRGLTAAFALSDMGPAAIAALRGALPHAGPRSISSIATALGGLKEQATAAVPELVAALARAGESRDYVIRALGDIGPGASEAAAPLSELLAADPANRMWILRALAKIGAADGPVVPEIAKLLDQLPPPQPLYRVTPEVIDTLGIIGTPQDVRLALESFYTDMSRPASNFAGFIRRKIGDDAFDRYGASILAASRVSTPHYCGISVDRAAGDAEYAADALRALGPEAASATDALRRAREKFGLCFNVVASIDAALSAIGSPGTR